MSTIREVGEFVSVPEGRIHFVKQGDGPPVILLHSNGQSIWGFEEIMEPLGREFSCYALDMLGCGESSKPPSNCTWQDVVGSVAHFIEASGIQRAHVVGVSIGAAIGVELAAGYPERVDRLALVGCPVWDVRGARQRIQAIGNDYDDRGMPKPNTAELLKSRGSFADPRPEWVEKLDELYTKAGRSKYEVTVALAWYDLVSRLHHIKAPTLVLYGEVDPLRDGEDMLVHNIPNARKVVMPGLGHHPPTEDPEAFVAEVLPFLKGGKE